MFEKFDETKKAQGMETCAMSDYMGLVPSKKLISICGKSCSTFIPVFLSNQIHGHSLGFISFQSFNKREANGEFGHHLRAGMGVLLWRKARYLG